ncbi:MAG: hypothetical protein RLZZ399_2058 [Verrucomicrobiota bacterium]|jgi:hypothetical protein
MKSTDELIEAHLNSDPDPAEAEALLQRLKTEPEAMRAFVDALIFEEQIRAQVHAMQFQNAAEAFHAEIAQSTPHRSFRSRLRSAWIPAAAGLLFGLFSASLVFGYVSTLSSKSVPLLKESFEDAPAPGVRGMPLTAGTWGGDYTEITGETEGVQPLSGKKMLRFLRADYEGKPPTVGWISEIYRIVDVRSFSAEFATGKYSAQVEASFYSIPFPEEKQYAGSVEVHAVDTLPVPDRAFLPDRALLFRRAPALNHADSSDRGDFDSASALRSLRLKSATTSWQKIRVDLRIPPGTQYLVVGLCVSEPSAWKGNPDSSEVTFPGQFADDVSISISSSP